MLTRGEIFKATDLQKETITVREWGGNIIIQAMTGALRWEYMEYTDKEKNYLKWAAKLITLSVIDKDGNFIFDSRDIPKLMGKNHRILNDIGERILKINKMDLLAREEAEKNSESNQS